MLKKNLYIILVILVIMFQLLNAAKKKKNRAQEAEKKPVDPKSYKPNKTTPELWCDTCNAIVRETHKLLRGKSSEADVYDLTDDVCNPERYYVYSNVLKK